MVWNTNIELNLFNALKALTVFLLFKPVTTYLTLRISTALFATILHKHHVAKLNSLGPCAALFDGFIISSVPGRRSLRYSLLTAFLLLLTVWVGTGAEVLFEYGISSFGSSVTRVTTVRSTVSGNPSVTYTEGRNDIMAQIGLLERACPERNTLSTLTNVYVDPVSPNITYCSPNVLQRSLCASGRTLLGEPCVPPMFPNASSPTATSKNWTSETWLSLIFTTTKWTFQSDQTENDNGFVTFEPERAQYTLSDRQLFALDIAYDNVYNVTGLRRVHCGSGSSLLNVSKPGDIPFQVCLWEFERDVLVTHADWLIRKEKESGDISGGVSSPGEGVRQILDNVSWFGVTARGRWISISKSAKSYDLDRNGNSEEIVQRRNISARDVMLTLGIARPLVKFSSEDGVSFNVDTFELGLWSSATMSLRVMERAILLGISVVNDGDVIDAEVVSDTRQIATVDLPFLVQYLASVVVLAAFAVSFSVMSRKNASNRAGR
ncbi:hypothetical protein BWQ96_02573 [Gracilariopsis chorda]|uniref:Uncharacterized protein n=1 Tax=Gracilariopsis chorda TaxID=448386 RepID=A0A2V3IZM0_9FLOR|nr:hypothetical protein BWQ96_02573 [Gracilariopsis chorda]|eukprot:PXF47594.1 hypothetical protein BWQ96_02573 [Gracilariopsis chorda]